MCDLTCLMTLRGCLCFGLTKTSESSRNHEAPGSGAAMRGEMNRCTGKVVPSEGATVHK